MKVILNKDVPNLGEEGDVREVAPGYARNYLLPQGFVLEYNDRNIARIDERRAEIEARKEQKLREAQTLKERLESEPLAIEMTAGTNGRLFGSVTSATIAEHLSRSGIEVERKRIDIPESSLKAIGSYKVRVRLYGGEEATLTVKVTASNARELEERRKSEQPAQEQVGEDVVADTAAETAAEEQVEGDEFGDYGDEEILDPEVIAMRAAQAEEEREESPPEE